MDAIVLAGGRGKRLGRVGELAHKGVLVFQGKSLLEHVLENLLHSQHITKVIILTGHRGDDIHAVVDCHFSSYLECQRLQILDSPNVCGSFSRLAFALSLLGSNHGYYVCGVDCWIPLSALVKFWDFLKDNHNYSSLLLSPYLEIAPTHGLVSLNENSLVTNYVCGNDQLTISTKKAYLVDVGVRYFCSEMCEEIINTKFFSGQYMLNFLAEVAPKNQRFLGCLFFEPWRHFATIHDFHSSRSLLPL